VHALRLCAPATFEHVPDAPSPTPRPGQVTVRLDAAAICGSDLPKFRSTADPRCGRPGFPVHECVGHIVAADTETGLEPGQRVLAMPDDDCGLAEIYRADPDTTHPISAHHLTDAQATLIQPLATVLYATAKLGTVTGAHVAVLGLGPIGLLCAHILHQHGARVTGVDPVARSTHLTTAFGIDHHLHAVATAWPATAHAADPVDICVEAVGHQQQTIRDAVAITRHSGTILALGVPDDADYTFPYQALLRGNITLKTSITPPWQEFFGPAEDYLCTHLDTLSRLITHTFPITEATAAYHAYAQPTHDRLKVIISAARGWNSTRTRS
jgi:threonine dehydrogenase-like Zn-dependent dehydrogenase